MTHDHHGEMDDSIMLETLIIGFGIGLPLMAAGYVNTGLLLGMIGLLAATHIGLFQN